MPIPKIQVIKSRGNVTYVVTIPKAIAEAKGWAKGTEVEFKIKNSDLVIQEVRKNEN